MDTLITIKPELLSLTGKQIEALFPYIVVLAGILMGTLIAAIRKDFSRLGVLLVLLLTAVVGAKASSALLHADPVTLFNGMMVSDAYSNFFNIIFLLAASITALVSLNYLEQEKLHHPEYYLLLMFSAFGMMLLSSATDLLVVFISLEVMSLAVYVLVGFRRNDRRSNEAAMKYFILGSAASAVLLYGTALLYGATGYTDVRSILNLVQNNPVVFTTVFNLGVGLVLIGFLFKVACVPFHMWMPDVYEGAPVPVTGFMTTGLKAAAFAVFLRIFLYLGYGQNLSAILDAHLHEILWWCAVLTMVVGNLIALTQTNLKRLLAYSSIAHSGYILIGILSGAQSEEGYSSVVMYLVSYIVMNMGAFVVLTVLARRADSGLNLHDMAGLSKRHPWLAFSMAIFFFSLAGVPPTAGFAAKYLIFYSAVQANEVPLVVIAVLCSAISVYYYLRVLVYIYMRDPVVGAGEARVPTMAAILVAAMVVLTLHIGVLPARTVSVAKKAIASI
ncbi:MAG: NADH-quinone oxidoreductase subunit N [Bdellovibrionota bacterium]